MARTPRQTAPIEQGPEVNAVALASAAGALAALSEQAQAVATAFGLTSMEPAVLESEISGFVAQTGRALFEIGVRLYAMRTVVSSADWRARIEALGFSPRAAARMMGAALKIADANGQARSSLLALPQAKVLELITLDDASLDQLEKDGHIGQLSLDFEEIDRLSATELRERVRKLERDATAKDRVIAAKTKKLNELEDERNAQSPEDVDAMRAAELLLQVRDATSAAEVALAQLAQVAGQSQVGGWPDHVHTAGRTAVEYVAQRLADLIHEAGVPVQFETMVQPEWLAAAPKKAKRAA